MDGSGSGLGLDYVWAKVLSPDGSGITVIDDLEMTHTRPAGGGKF